MMTRLVDDSVLLARYIDVLNWSLQAHRNHLRVLERLEVARVPSEERSVATVVRHRDGSPETRFAVCFTDGKLCASSVPHDDPEYVWRLNREHLERVVESPREFLHHPEQLDWGWMQVEEGRRLRSGACRGAPRPAAPEPSSAS